ncbi:hypothetical protein QR680_012731 [Steinernema hermaphroditum]|uniref:Tyr recombinase domain-containing protein n=1 Tax=Steinernema hermaphroditum TaxID=289476 RepID=A0AA39I5J4_9BILA|nr:hypothetical protein QR680_012731 [Steinernema hermaphroditum]
MFQGAHRALCRFVAPEIATAAVGKLQAAKEKSTMRSYTAAISKFQAWRDGRIKDKVSPNEVMAYLTQLLVQNNSTSAVQVAASALKWYFSFYAGPNPVDSVWIRTLLEGVRREGRIPTHRPKITEIEMRLLARWQAESIKDQRILTLLATLYAGCLRPSEGTCLRRCQVQLAPGRMVLYIIRDKTNKQGAGRPVVIQESPGRFCAVKLMKNWLQISPKSDYVFPCFKDCSRPISYDTARQEWTRVATLLQMPRHVTLHGFRGGAATKAIEEGAPVDEVMRHGRWKRVETLKAYVETSEKTTPVASSLMRRLRLDGETEVEDREASAPTSVPEEEDQR